MQAAICLLCIHLLALKTCFAGSTPPVITAQPVGQTVLLSGSVTFSVTASSGTTLSYQWLKNGATIAGATSSSYTISSVQTNDAASYSVLVSNAGGTVTSSSATLTVLVPPTIISQPQSLTVSIGQTAVFSVGAGGTAPLRYQWRLGTTKISSATNATLTLTNVQTSQAGDYVVVITNSFGSITSSIAALTVSRAPAITAQPQSQALILGQTAVFTVAAGGAAPLNYQWNFNGTNIAGATSAVLTLTNIDPSVAGSYSVVLTNLAGAATSAVATLNILIPAPGSYLEAVATNNPLGYWRLGELSGPTAFDCAGGNNATYTNVTLNQPGALATDNNPSAAFNGTNAYAGTGVSLANNLPAFTLEGWFKLTAARARMGLFGQNNVIELGLDTKTTLQIYTQGGGSVTVTNLWSTNSWHHIAAAGNGTQLLLYVDGSLAGVGGVATTNYGAPPIPSISAAAAFSIPRPTGSTAASTRSLSMVGRCRRRRFNATICSAWPRPPLP